MKVRGQGNAIPIALGVLAVVIAGSGTAVAVSSTTTISDPAVPSQIAHVDAAGQLLTTSTAQTSTLILADAFENVGVTYLSSPTTASLAVTGLQVAETSLNGQVNGSDLYVYLLQLQTSGGNCTNVTARTLAMTAISSGDHVSLLPSVPLLVKPIGTSSYCLGLKSLVTNNVADATTYFPRYSFAGYVAKGTYTGLGTKPTPAAPLPAKKGS